MNQKDIKIIIKDIERNLNNSLKANIETNEWSKLWCQHAIDTLLSANQRLKNLSEGEMQVFDQTLETRPFWIKIMKTFESSIWTTNLASTNSFGSDLDSLLIVQKKAIEAEKQIQRVFVFDPEDNVTNSKLVTVMTNQLFYKIDVYAIEKNVFNNSSTSLGFAPRTMDFMIIDDKYCYQTDFNFEVHSNRNSMSKDEEFVANMIKIKKQIMKSAIKITLGNIKNFPNII